MRDSTGRCGPHPARGPSDGAVGPLLSLAVGRPVVDKTGMTGIYDIELTFTQNAALAAIS